MTSRTSIEQATIALVNNWLDAREETGLQPATVNRIRAYMMSAFTKAIGAGVFFGANPVTGTRKRLEERRVRRPLAVTSASVLIDNAPNATWRTALAIAAYAGLRRSEIARLTWSNVDLVSGMISVRQTKASRDRIVPIHPVLRMFSRRRRGVPG